MKPVLVPNNLRGEPVRFPAASGRSFPLWSIRHDISSDGQPRPWADELPSSKDLREHLMEPLEAKQEELWRRHERTGRPPGEAAFLDQIEAVLGRPVRPAKRGPKGPKPK